MDIYEAKHFVGKVILQESIEEAFWSQYRNDSDIDVVKKAMENALGKEVMDIIFLSLKEYVDIFAKMQKTTKEADDQFVKDTSFKLADAIIVSHQTLIESFFEIGKGKETFEEMTKRYYPNLNIKID